MNRRQFLRTTTACSAAAFLRLDSLLFTAPRDPFAGGTFLGLVDFLGEGPAPLETPIGEELDKRLYSDLSGVKADRAVTPVSEFYIRTGVSQLLPGIKNWEVRLSGLVEQPAVLSAARLRSESRPMGVHLMECAGNNRLTRFGLLSVADWTGVPFSDIANRVKLRREAARVVVSGFDRYATQSRTSIPGASWIFRLDELHAARAFVATKMNDAPLARDHGAPMRLVVPGWYGCACIKWVQEIAFVEDDVTSTSQMQEFAARTLQDGIPRLAKEYQPATIDQAAMPVRIEKWRVAGKTQYRIVGILWGGTRRVNALKIRFNPEQEYVPVDGFHQTANDPWTIWTHAWTPPAPDTYAIRLAVTDPPVRARKLDSGYYVRSVQIAEV